MYGRDKQEQEICVFGVYHHRKNTTRKCRGQGINEQSNKSMGVRGLANLTKGRKSSRLLKPSLCPNDFEEFFLEMLILSADSAYKVVGRETVGKMLHS